MIFLAICIVAVTVIVRCVPFRLEEWNFGTCSSSCITILFRSRVAVLGFPFKLQGKTPAPDLPSEDVPTASFGILSIEAYRKSASNMERQPVAAEYATLNLSTMQADARYNTPEEYDSVMETIHSLVPYFTREYLAAYVGRFVVHTEGSAWDVCSVKASTSIFVSHLRSSRTCCNSLHKLELIRDIGGSDIRLEDHEGSRFRLPHRPASSNAEGKMRPPMDYSLREC